MKSKKVIVLILVVLITGIIIFSTQRSQDTKSPIVPTTLPTPSEPEKLRECPDVWYKNMMPIIVDIPKDANHAGEYLIVDGQRRELSEYDVEWITDNCEVTGPQPIY